MLSGAQVLPIAIHRFDQGDLLLSAPALDLLLTSDGGQDFTERLVVDQSVDVVACRKPLQQLASVLEHQTFQVASHPGIQRAGFARHDVNVVSLQRWNPRPRLPPPRARFLAADLLH